MRLQLTALAVALLPGTATPTESSARFDSYSDGRISVVTPSTRVLHPFEGGEVEARYGVDVLSGATPRLTVDGISSATRFEETRHEGHLGGRWRPTTGDSLGLAVAMSVEPDFRTVRLVADGELELLERMATLAAGYTVDINRAGRSDDPGYVQDAHSHSLDVGWIQILGRRTQATAQITARADACEEDLGCHANPYRYVAAGAGARWVVPERHPSLRLRGAAALRLAQGLAPHLAVHAGYRYYADSWQVEASTADLALAQALWAERLVLRAEGRFTWQTGASFYRDDYPAEAGRVPAYRTADRELAALWSAAAGGRVEGSLSALGPVRRLRVNARVLRLWYRYSEVSEFARCDAWLLGAGLTAAF